MMAVQAICQTDGLAGDLGIAWRWFLSGEPSANTTTLSPGQLHHHVGNNR